MNKKIKKIIPVFILPITAFLFITTKAEAQTRPTIPPIQPDPMTGCTGYETESKCHPEWADALANCVVGTFDSNTSTCTTANPDLYKIFPTVNVCSAKTMNDRCKPQRYNIYAATDLARRAEIMGREIGLQISCPVKKESIAGPDNNSHLNYYYNTYCTIEGIYGFDPDLLVNDPARNTSYTNWDVTLTTIKSSKAIEVCGGPDKTFFNPDGTYRCITSTQTPTQTSTQTNIQTSTQNQTTINQTNISQNINSYSSFLLSSLSSLVNNLKNHLQNSSGSNAIASQTTQNAYNSSLISSLNQMVVNLKSQLNSIQTNQKTSSTKTSSGITTPTIISIKTPDPYVELTLGNNQKSGIYSVGDTINYQIKMENVDSVSSNYVATPGDSCVGGSNNGESKPWVLNSVSSKEFSARVEECQKGNNYIITTIGKSSITGKTTASSISVYIKN